MPNPHASSSYTKYKNGEITPPCFVPCNIGNNSEPYTATHTRVEILKYLKIVFFFFYNFTFIHFIELDRHVIHIQQLFSCRESIHTTGQHFSLAKCIDSLNINDVIRQPNCFCKSPLRECKDGYILSNK